MNYDNRGFTNKMESILSQEMILQVMGVFSGGESLYQLLNL